MPKVQIDLTESENKALDRYRKPRKWSKQNALRFLMRKGLMSAGKLKQTAADVEAGIVSEV